MTDLLTPAVRRFIARHLRSPEDLEVLILVVTTPERGWTAAAVASELRISGASAQATLEHLCGRNLLDVRISENLLYRFNPGTEALGRAVEELLTAYRDSRLAVTAAVADAASARLREFADAFRVRDTDEEDTPDRG